MNATVLYSLQTILSAGVFILIYRLFVRNTNAYNWNRFYLLATMIVSLLLPHFNISNCFTVEKPIMFYATIIDLNQTIPISPDQQVQHPFTVYEIIMAVYWVIVGLLLLRFGWGILRINKFVKNNNYKTSGNLRLYPIQRKTTFSFFNYIFIQPSHWDKPVTDYIIRHEEAHVKHMHSLDNLLTELIMVFGWFNPFYYIYRRDLHLLHECQADQQVINSGCDTSTYHQLLLNEVSGNLTYIIVNQFSYSLIKRRFKMISKNKQSRLAGFRILLAIPATFVLLLIFSFTSLDKTSSLLKNKTQQIQSSLDIFQNPQQKSASKTTIKFTPHAIAMDDDTTKRIAEIVTNYKRGFPGGTTEMIKFIRSNYKYPHDATKISKMSIISLSFIASETGELGNTKVYKGIDLESDNEALRVVKMMPKWIPYQKEGKPVSMLIHLEIFLVPDKTNANLPPQINVGLTVGPIPDPTASNDDTPLLMVEQNPEFKGGYDAFLKFIVENMKYPEEAKRAGVQGTVFLSFVVDKAGKVSDIKIVRGIGSGCDEEAIRVVMKMPDWIPGRNGGKVVPVVFQIPIKFQLAMNK